MAAMVTAIGTAYTMVLATERANNIMFIPTRFKDCLAAFSLRVEVGGKFVDAIETAEVNHKSQVLRFLYYIYLKLGRLFHKSPDFFDYFSETYEVFMDNRYIVPKKRLGSSQGATQSLCFSIPDSESVSCRHPTESPSIDDPESEGVVAVLDVDELTATAAGSGVGGGAARIAAGDGDGLATLGARDGDCYRLCHVFYWINNSSIRSAG